jgi:hypothetical protein
MRVGPSLVVSLATALLGEATLTGCSSAAPKPAEVSPSNTCACPWAVGVGNYNVSMPDSNAVDWFQRIVASEATSIAIAGTCPDARYFSVSVYTPCGTPVSVDGVSSSLSDYRIVPDHGGVNPWQHRAAPGGRHRVTVRSGVAPGETNALPYPVGTHLPGGRRHVPALLRQPDDAALLAVAAQRTGEPRLRTLGAGCYPGRRPGRSSRCYGDLFPRVYTCALTTLTAKGITACEP